MSFRMSSLGRIAASKFAAAAASGPDSNTLLLMNWDAAHNSTTMLDSSSYNRTFTRNNGPVVSNFQSKFGGTSLSTTGAIPNYIYTTEGSTWPIADDFTFEGWAYGASFASASYLWHLNNKAGYTGSTLAFGVSATAKLNTCLNGSDTLGTTSVSANTWFHWCVERTSGIIRAYLNGALEITLASDTGVLNSASGGRTYIGAGMTAGGSGANRYWCGGGVGYIDSIRLSNVSRYAGAASISVPTAAYS